MTRPLLLDAFCGAGGAGKGYHDAGFDVIGVDLHPQPRYPFTFRQMDALEALRAIIEHGPRRIAAVHASPPCQRFSRLTARWGRQDDHPDLIAATRELLIETGLPWVIENVEGAPLRDPVTLCGSSFGLDLRRHRHFESNVPLQAPLCDHAWQTPRFKIPDRRSSGLSRVVPVYGNPNYAGDVGLWKKAMGIDWMVASELREAIPPAYTEHIGRQLMAPSRRRP